MTISSSLDRTRYPDVIFTTGYANDPIRFQSDDRFENRTVVQQLSGSLNDQLSRDFADFLKVDKNNDAPQLLTVSMYSPLVKRNEYVRVVGPRSTFEQF